ncbi:MAG: 16S rRNA (cytosine(1402)-N(4))-methyltransferase RsmH [Bacteroidetes bacterium]|nr:MAG: 16S rRNA (cytosine(1402)-N(4))-methyltransferase RsmH [Bacteroidota bacterium]
MKVENSRYHIPVLLHQAINALNVKLGGVYADVTFGGGGYSREILSGIGKEGKLIVFDKDEEALKNPPHDEQVLKVHADYKYLKNYLKFYGIMEIDGLVADLGVSSYQFDSKERGFMFREDDVELDMRMDKQSVLTAKRVLNEYDVEQLAQVFRVYGEIKNAKSLARKLVKHREDRVIETSSDLKEALGVKMHSLKKQKQFYAKVFQALRIEVNQELESLKEMLLQAAEVLKPGGRMVVVSYHSLEDRLVKYFFKTGNFKGEEVKDFYGRTVRPLKPVNTKVITPDQEEIEKNPRARSAKLRIAEKLS